MSSLLAQDDQSEYANQQSEQIRIAAHNNKKWAAIVTVALVLVGVIGGGVWGASSNSGDAATAGGVGGAVFGGLGALIAGMAFYVKRRLDSEVALRMDEYFRERMRTR